MHDPTLANAPNLGTVSDSRDGLFVAQGRLDDSTSLA